MERNFEPVKRARFPIIDFQRSLPNPGPAPWLARFTPGRENIVLVGSWGPTSRSASASAGLRTLNRLSTRGRLQLVRPKAANLVFMLIARRYEQASLIVTSNEAVLGLGPGGWGDLGDEVATSAGDRPARLPPILAPKGDSYRLKTRRPQPRVRHRPGSPYGPASTALAGLMRTSTLDQRETSRCSIFRPAKPAHFQMASTGAACHTSRALRPNLYAVGRSLAFTLHPQRATVVGELAVDG